MDHRREPDIPIAVAHGAHALHLAVRLKEHLLLQISLPFRRLSVEGDGPIEPVIILSAREVVEALCEPGALARQALLLRLGRGCLVAGALPTVLIGEARQLRITTFEREGHSTLGIAARNQLCKAFVSRAGFLLAL